MFSSSDKPRTTDDFVDAEEVLFSSLSSSLKAKYNQALKMVTESAAVLQRGDPEVVSADSSQFVVI